MSCAVSGTDELTTPTTNPTTPTTDPTTPTTDPTKPTTDPTKPTTDPTEPSTDPTTPTTDPTKPSTDPTTPTTDPTKPSTDPTTPTSVPTTPGSSEVCPIFLASVPYSLRVWKNGWSASPISFPSDVTAITVLDSSIVVQLADKSFMRGDAQWTAAYKPAPVAFVAICRYGNALRGADADGNVYRFDGDWVKEYRLPAKPSCLVGWDSSMAFLSVDGVLYLLDGAWRASETNVPALCVSIAQAGGVRYALTSGNALWSYDGIWRLDGRDLPVGTIALLTGTSGLYVISK